MKNPKNIAASTKHKIQIMTADPNKNHNGDFETIHRMIVEAGSKVWQQINSILIQLYWSIGRLVNMLQTK